MNCLCQLVKSGENTTSIYFHILIPPAASKMSSAIIPKSRPKPPKSGLLSSPHFFLVENDNSVVLRPSFSSCSDTDLATFARRSSTGSTRDLYGRYSRSSWASSCFRLPLAGLPGLPAIISFAFFLAAFASTIDIQPLGVMMCCFVRTSEFQLLAIWC